MSKIYILELHPRTYGLFPSKKRWEKKFPNLRQLSSNRYLFKTTEDTLPYYKRVCKRMRVDCLLYEERFARSRNYRARFLKAHPPLPNGKYRCWYCGKKTRNISVDHIISIAAVKKDPKLQNYLDRKGIDINGEENLALCCRKCNQKKGDQQSRFYLRRSRIGRHEAYWKFRHFLQFLLILALLVLFLLLLIPFCCGRDFLSFLPLFEISSI